MVVGSYVPKCHGSVPTCYGSAPTCYGFIPKFFVLPCFRKFVLGSREPFFSKLFHFFPKSFAIPEIYRLHLKKYFNSNHDNFHWLDSQNDLIEIDPIS